MSDFSDSAARRHAYDFYIKLPLARNSDQNYRIRLRRFLSIIFYVYFSQSAKFNQPFIIERRLAMARRSYIEVAQSNIWIPIFMGANPFFYVISSAMKGGAVAE